jgi:hypothetical protein
VDDVVAVQDQRSPCAHTFASERRGTSTIGSGLFLDAPRAEQDAHLTEEAMTLSGISGPPAGPS